MHQSNVQQYVRTIGHIVHGGWGCKDWIEIEHITFSHLWQGSIDFSTVNIHHTECVCFLIFTVAQGVYREILP